MKVGKTSGQRSRILSTLWNPIGDFIRYNWSEGKKTNTGIRLRENERNEKSKCRWYFQICFKGEKRNREVVGEGCGSRKSFLFFSFFFLYEEYYTIFTMDGSSFVI